jgi:signal transduction histidine kinase
MRRTLAVTVLACATGAGIVGAFSGAHAALVTLCLLIGVCAAALAAALRARRSRARIGSLSRQLALAVGIAVGAILLGVWVAAEVMFISNDDARLVSVMAAVIAVVGVCVASVLTDPLVYDIEQLRDRLRAVGVGDRRVDLVLGGRDELSDLAVAANAMIEQLRAEEAGRAAAEDARRRLIGAVSHDLRTPIAALRVLIEAVQDRIVTGATRTRYLREMQTHVSILSALIDDLFDLTRAQAEEISLARSPVEIGELVSETVTAMLCAAEQRGVTLHAEPPTGHAPGTRLTTRADPEQIQRVLLNLLENAIRHTPPGGDVTVSTTSTETKIEVEVADEGIGIAREDREHVFEAFYRGGEHAARSDNGAGLGLAIARAIINAHHGEIWLAPAQQGTRVCFTLPALAQLAAPTSSQPIPIGELDPHEEHSSKR